MTVHGDTVSGTRFTDTKLTCGCDAVAIRSSGLLEKRQTRIKEKVGVGAVIAAANGAKEVKLI